MSTPSTPRAFMSYGSAVAGGVGRDAEEPQPSEASAPNVHKFSRSVQAIVRFKRLGEKAEEKAKAARFTRDDETAPVVSPPPPPPPRSPWDVSADVAGLKELVGESWRAMAALVLFSLLALVSNGAGWGPVATFTLAFIALCPLAVLLGDLTESLAGWCGPTLGGLLNATLGNATEAIVLVQALRHRLVRVEQAALLGGVLSNMLLVLGLSFLVGGKSTFDKSTAVADIGVLSIAGVAIVLPSVATGAGGVTHLTLDDSRASALVLLAMYACLLVYTLRKPPPADGAAEGKSLLKREEEEAEEEEAEEAPSLSLWSIIGVLLLITVLMAVLANMLVLAIFPVAHALRISSNVIACIFLPVIGNASELASAVVAASHGHMDLALGIALGSSCQISLFLLPVAVLFGWAIDVPFSLDFQYIFAAAFLLSVIVGAIVLLDGKGTWLKGAMLLGMYAVFITALVFGNPDEAAGPQPAPAPSLAFAPPQFAPAPAPVAA